MDSSELVETLEQAGLAPYQADAYVALLEYGATSATELASASGVPKPRIYDVLEELEERGYVETYEAGSLHARAHSPAGVMEDLRSRAELFESAAGEVEERWQQPDLESSRASIVKRFRTVYERASAFVDGAEHQVHVSLTAEEFQRLRPRLAAAHERGVSVRVSVHTNPGEATPDLDFRGACSEARHREFPAPFVTLVDRRKTCFAHHPDAFEEYGVLVDDRTHAHVFHWYFRTALWDLWDTLYVATGDGPVPRSACGSRATTSRPARTSNWRAGRARRSSRRRATGTTRADPRWPGRCRWSSGRRTARRPRSVAGDRCSSPSRRPTSPSST